MPEPLSDDEVEALLHEVLRLIVDASAATDEGREALRIAMTGPYAALLRFNRREPLPLPQRD